MNAGRFLLRGGARKAGGVLQRNAPRIFLLEPFFPQRVIVGTLAYSSVVGYWGRIQTQAANIGYNSGSVRGRGIEYSTIRLTLTEGSHA